MTEQIPTFELQNVRHLGERGLLADLQIPSRGMVYFGVRVYRNQHGVAGVKFSQHVLRDGVQEFSRCPRFKTQDGYRRFAELLMAEAERCCEKVMTATIKDLENAS